MNNFFKALGATSLTVAPVLLKEILAPQLHNGWIAFYAIAVFGGSWKFVFKPDNRFEAIRNPSLDSFFDNIFSNVTCVDGARFPLRVNLYEPRGASIFTKLRVTYGFNQYSTDPDFGKSWKPGRGLTGKVYETGKAGFFRKGEDVGVEYVLSRKDAEDTSRVEAVFALPIRRAKPKLDSPADSTVVAVLSIDALTSDGAEVLRGWYNSLEDHANGDLLDKLKYLSLFYP